MKYPKGTPFGLGQLSASRGKRKRNEANETSSMTGLAEILQQLDAANRRIAQQDDEYARQFAQQAEDNARREAAHRDDQDKLSEMVKLLNYLKNSDPRIAAHMADTSSTEPEPGAQSLAPPAAGNTPQLPP
ncbi:hypothetical protein AALP_AA2G055900 [Arabis alpina]|uniref:Uncharacterized protein n=1 Tax=Arabis alpina TaxID=50452 RepID=A0A087HFI6_ARAAL|nr:hypothetical protein AALP_AA2G055900 [Arabis alpina]